MKRRTFLENTTAISGGSLLPLNLINNLTESMTNIGIQLFSLPKLLEADFRSGIQMLSQMGYNELEFYGPFPFSADSVKESWAAITPSLGFSGSGYFGHTPKEVKHILNEHKMSAVATHCDLETLQTKMGLVGKAAETMGFKYAGIPAIPEEMRQDLDGYKKMAEAFNKIGKNAKKEGLKFSYHNHGYGLQEMEGQIPLNLLLDLTDPELVFFEMDIFWMTAGGADPVTYLDTYPDRYHLLHLKDMKEEVRFDGDGGTPDQWIKLFPYMTTAGDGVLDIKSIIESAEKAAVKHYFVEQDMVEGPEIALQRSIDYLKEL